VFCYDFSAALKWNGIVERFDGTVRAETDSDYGDNYLQAEATIVGPMHHFNEERLYATFGCMTPATWHRRQSEEVRTAAHAYRKFTKQRWFTEAA
jgi:hypothetical protein